MGFAREVLSDEWSAIRNGLRPDVRGRVDSECAILCFFFVHLSF